MFVAELRSEQGSAKGGGWLTPRGTLVVRRVLVPGRPVRWTHVPPGFLIAGMNNSAFEDPVIQTLAQYEEKQLNRPLYAPRPQRIPLCLTILTKLRL
jgi:hypothetical protein